MKTHYATCDKANESYPEDTWGENTACGLEVYETEVDLTDDKKLVTCKKCLKRLKTEELNL